MIKKLIEWHLKFGVPVLDKPQVPLYARIRLRHDILVEEVNELYKAMLDENIVEVADAIADCLYVLLGTACECGLQNHIEEIFNEVHRSNMSKLDENGKPIYRSDGKVLKSKLFTPPNISKIINHEL